MDALRIRIYAVTDLLEITYDDEPRILRADHAALTDAVRATDAIETLAREWREFQAQLLYGAEADVAPPRTAIVPPITGHSRAGASCGKRGPRGTRPCALASRGGYSGFVDRLIAHPNTTDQTLFDLGLLPDATIGFSSGTTVGVERPVRATPFQGVATRGYASL